MHNLADVLPERTRRMVEQYEQWAKRIGARDWDELITRAGFGEFQDIVPR